MRQRRFPADMSQGKATNRVVAAVVRRDDRLLVAWAILHARWRKRDVAAGRVLLGALVLVGLGVVMTFPPVWGLL